MCQGVGVQIGLSETTVLKDYHKDALDRYNVTCDFPTVIRELVDPHKRFPFQVDHLSRLCLPYFSPSPQPWNQAACGVFNIALHPFGHR